MKKKARSVDVRRDLVFREDVTYAQRALFSIHEDAKEDACTDVAASSFSSAASDSWPGHPPFVHLATSAYSTHHEAGVTQTATYKAEDRDVCLKAMQFQQSV